MATKTYAATVKSVLTNAVKLTPASRDAHRYEDQAARSYQAEVVFSSGAAGVIAGTGRQWPVTGP